MKNQSEKQQKKFLSGLTAVMLATVFIIQILSVQVIGDDTTDKVLLDIYNDSCYMEWTESNDMCTLKSDYVESGRNKSSENTSSSITVMVYSVDGKIEAPPLFYSEAMLSYLNARDKPIVFVNNMSGDDKIDVLLREYSLLYDKGYLINMRVDVIVLPGHELKKGIYAITPGSGEVEIAGVKTCRKILSLGGIATRTYKTLPFIAANLPYQNVFELAEEEYVAHIFLDKKYHICLNESVPVIKPSGRWSQIEDYFGCEINGSSIKIAILDTGIDKTHPDLDDLDDNSSTNDSKVIAEKCFTGEGHTWDGHGHGTHCASIAAGTGEASNYTYVGVAPKAHLINGKVLADEEASGSESGIIEGIEWAVTNQSANILSMSFGADINGDGTDPLSMAVDWAIDQGAICAIAAGNSGLQGMFTVGTPAVARKAVTVGATTKNDEVVYISGWWGSSRGPTSDYRLKPDVCAPGLYIVAARANGTNMGSIVNDYYTKASGTSMATPHIAGAAALILQVHPNWNPIMVKSALMGNAKVLDDEHLWEQGAGRIDLCNSTNTTLLIIEPSSAFGILGLEDTATTTLTIMNLANTSKTVNISTFTISNWNETNYVSANVSLVTIASGSNTSISMQVGPLDNNASQGWYEGWLNITNRTIVRAPYLFAAHFTTTQQLREGGGGGGFSLFSNPFSLITGLIGIITELPLEIISASPIGQPNIIDTEEQSNIIDDIGQSGIVDEKTYTDASEILMDWGIIIKEDYRELLLSL